MKIKLDLEITRP